MRLAVQNPHLADIARPRALQPWGGAFIRRYQPWIFLSSPGALLPYLRWARRAGLGPAARKVVVGLPLLNRLADVLLCFNGRNEQWANCPLRGFHGMKVSNLVDYSFYANAAHRAMVEAGVDYVLGYTDHGKYDGFFQALYPSYVDRVIPVPFSYNTRFVDQTPFAERIPKCVGLGSVNLVRDSYASAESLADYACYFSGEEYAHKFRHMLRVKADEMQDVMVSRFPKLPESKDTQYDIVAEYNTYQMFTTCESIMYYPSVKTFEGTACGSVLVCSDHPCFAALGFKDGENCVMHREFDVDDFHDKVAYHLGYQEQLACIQQAGKALVTGAYSPDAVAAKLYQDIEARWHG